MPIVKVLLYVITINKVNDNTGDKMNNAYNAIADIHKEFEATNRAFLSDELYERLNRSIKTLDISAYQDSLITMAISSYYDLQVENINTAIMKLDVLDDLTEDGQELYERAIEIRNNVLSNINERIGEINAMDSTEKLNLVSKSVLKDISPEVLENARDYIKFVTMKDNQFSTDLIKNIEADSSVNSSNAKTLSFFVRKVDQQFKDENLKDLRELSRIEDNILNYQEPEIVKYDDPRLKSRRAI